jgi:hypothetical protein
MNIKKLLPLLAVFVLGFSCNSHEKNLKNSYDEGCTMITTITPHQDVWNFIDLIKGDAIVVKNDISTASDSSQHFRITGHVPFSFHTVGKYTVRTVEKDSIVPSSLGKSFNASSGVIPKKAGISPDTLYEEHPFKYSVILYNKNSEFTIELLECTSDETVEYYRERVAWFIRESALKHPFDSTAYKAFSDSIKTDQPTVDAGSTYVYRSTDVSMDIDGIPYAWRNQETLQYSEFYKFNDDQDYVLMSITVLVNPPSPAWRRYDSGEHTGITEAGFLKNVYATARLMPWDGYGYPFNDNAVNRVFVYQYSPETTTYSTSYSSGMNVSLGGSFGFGSSGPSANFSGNVTWSSSSTTQIPDICATVDPFSSPWKYGTQFDYRWPDYGENLIDGLWISDPPQPVNYATTYKYCIAWCISDPTHPETMTTPPTPYTGKNAPYRVDVQNSIARGCVELDYTSWTHFYYTWKESKKWLTLPLWVVDIEAPNRIE